MNHTVKKLNVNNEYLQTHNAIPFTLNKKLKGKEVYSWNTVQGFFPEEMRDSKEVSNRKLRIQYFMDNAKTAGLDDLAMPDQPKGDKLIEACHEITFEEFNNYYESKTAKDEGTIWNVDKNYTAIFMTKETHDKIKEKYHRSVSLVYPAADCAVVRFYDKEQEIIGLTHSNGYYTGENIIGKMTEYMKEHFHSDIDTLEAYVGAFAHEDWVYTNIPKFTYNEDKEGNFSSWRGNWSKYIEGLGDNKYKLHYGDMIYDQLIDSGIKKDNIYFSPENTLFDSNYFSHSRSATTGEKEGMNLIGITFDTENVIHNSDEVGTKLR